MRNGKTEMKTLLDRINRIDGAVARFAEGRRDYFGLPLMFGNHTGYNDNSTKFGRLTGATPDGRRAGEFLSFGGGPALGRGPAAATSVLLAAAQISRSSRQGVGFFRVFRAFQKDDPGRNNRPHRDEREITRRRPGASEDETNADWKTTDDENIR